MRDWAWNEAVKPQRNPVLPWRAIDDCTVVIDPDAGEVHELNSSAALLWELADGTRSLDEIASEVERAFDTDTAGAARDAREFYDGMEKKALLRWV